jgi:hypothetical protein
MELMTPREFLFLRVTNNHCAVSCEHTDQTKQHLTLPIPSNIHGPNYQQELYRIASHRVIIVPPSTLTRLPRRRLRHNIIDIYYMRQDTRAYETVARPLAQHLKRS